MTPVLGLVALATATLAACGGAVAPDGGGADARTDARADVVAMDSPGGDDVAMDVVWSGEIQPIADVAMMGDVAPADAAAMDVVAMSDVVAQDSGARDAGPNDAGGVRCGTTVCGPGQACCGDPSSPSSHCYAAGCLACCMPVPPDSGVRDAGPSGCASNASCGPTDFCNGTGCGTPGACEARPDLCPAIYDPVCGCDGATYGNDCEANHAGVRVESRGACGGSADAGAVCPACAAGQSCCTIARSPRYGMCYPSACLACCM